MPSEIEKTSLKFLERFEREFISQDFNENRDIEDTLNIGWKLLSILPESELTRIEPKIIRKYHPTSEKANPE